jgi:3-oxoadipate CoA-transferase alpha subunit
MTTVVADADEAVSGIGNGSTVLIGGFGTAGQPVELIEALIRSGVTDLTVVNNNAGNGRVGLAALLANGQVRKIICSFPRQADSYPTGVGTPLTEGKERRTIDGRDFVLEYPLSGDVALIKAFRADTLGNLVYRKTARNFGPVMATAAKTTVAQVAEIVGPGGIDPEIVVTPGIFVDCLVQIAGVSPLAQVGAAG